MSGKDILINEFQYVTKYKLSVSYVPVFTNKYTYVEFEVDFKEILRSKLIGCSKTWGIFLNMLDNLMICPLLKYGLDKGVNLIIN